MRKILLLLFVFLSFTVLAASVEAKYGQRWMVEYGCRGSGCNSGGYVPPIDRYVAPAGGGAYVPCGVPCNAATYYTPAGVKVTDPVNIMKDYLQLDPKPGQSGYISGMSYTINPNTGVPGLPLVPCHNSGCFNGNLLNTSGPVNITGFGTSAVGGTAPAQIAGIKFVQLVTYAGGSGSGGGPTVTPGGPTTAPGTPTVVWVTATPTPTPTPTAAPGPWSRLKDSSFLSDERIQSQIPASPIAYDTDDTTQPYFIIGDGGVVAASSLAVTGLNTSAKTNASDWKDPAYSMIPPAMLPDGFASYVKGRKENKTITSLDQINADGIYVYESINALDITTVPASFDQYNVVLVSTTTVNINTEGSFKPQKSLAIVAPVINFASTVTEAKGVFVSIMTDTGTTTNQGLKIIGNLIVNNNFTDGRKWANQNKPTLFVVFRPDMYLDLLPYLSVANYDWQQLQ